MGIREIRYCDISGTEDEVETHELNIDQMHIRIDLAGPEYRKLLDLLGPYLEAGTIEASIPGYGGRRAVHTSTGLTVEERAQLREWAESKGIEVPSNNRFKRTLVDQWREEIEGGGSESSGSPTLFEDDDSED
ncbi:hypothetical protein PSU4_07590 [Pseudonocardia sulfidoxydans NBRC 16205]|uniref:Lsr2 family protein n=1 Tax=Pseudonocardia sulfidoxydans NBRC 16205 TaxID=1223511 RepID=A0A511DAG3_9PSEU|nr:histone-like nucleoid-structuring protein Lsr2 [Pseudonocardia sulfidoxydans]GEL21805.1 hypothetical protein PSU4_07590 [Pseudonocardia sulfidoxydans NBRC 16205]